MRSIIVMVWLCIWEEATRGNIFLDQETIETGAVQRILLLTGASPIIAHRVAYQWNLWQNWEWAFPAPWDTLTMKCPKTWSNMTMKGPCWLEVGPCQLPLQRLKLDNYKMLTFNTPLKGVQGGDKKYGTLFSGMSPNSCIFSYLEKH